MSNYNEFIQEHFIVKIKFLLNLKEKILDLNVCILLYDFSPLQYFQFQNSVFLFFTSR